MRVVCSSLRRLQCKDDTGVATKETRLAAGSGLVWILRRAPIVAAPAIRGATTPASDHPAHTCSTSHPAATPHPFTQITGRRVQHLGQTGLRGHHPIHRIDVLVRGQDQSMDVVELPVCAMHARRHASRRRDGMGLAMWRGWGIETWGPVCRGVVVRILHPLLERRASWRRLADVRRLRSGPAAATKKKPASLRAISFHPTASKAYLILPSL